MASSAQMRKLALAMPEVEEKSHFEQADFRVHNKIFAGLSKDETRGTLKLTPEIQSMIVDATTAGPFSPCAGAWGRSGWTFVDLASVDVRTLQDLLHEAWRLVAPKRLVVAHDAQSTAPKAKVPTIKESRTAKTGRASTTAKTKSASKAHPKRPRRGPAGRRSSG